jgi:hypothetical protein
MPELPATSALINQIRALLPWKTFARKLASSAVWYDRVTAMRTINRWTFEEARQLGLKRCDNSPHDGQIAWYEEHGREETGDAVYRKLRCPLCGHETRYLIDHKRLPPAEAGRWVV